MWSHTHTHFSTPSRYLCLSIQSKPIYCLYSLNFIYRSEVVISSIWLKASELLSIQLNFSLLSFLKSLVIYFFNSPAVSRISQERQPHYQPMMCSSILLLCSDKGTARWVTQVHREPCRKQHFSHWSTVLHVNECQWENLTHVTFYLAYMMIETLLCKPA